MIGALAHPLAKCAVICACATTAVTVHKIRAPHPRPAIHKIAHKAIKRAPKVPVITERVVYRDCVLPTLPLGALDDQVSTPIVPEALPVITHPLQPIALGPIGSFTPGPPLTFTSPPVIRQPVDVPATVPEPATWGLMIIGFGLVGAVVRRKREQGSWA